MSEIDPEDLEATELEWLRWFFCKADFGPSDGDVRISLEREFEEETGRIVPSDYRFTN